MGPEEEAKADTFSITVELSMWFQVMVLKQSTHLLTNHSTVRSLYLSILYAREA